MIPLTTLWQFKELYDGYDVNGNPGPQRFLIWFSAAWCGPCQRMDKKILEETARECAIPFYYCDEVVNRETVEYVGIKSFPTFIMYMPKQEMGRRLSTETTKVCQWIRKAGLMQ